MKRKKGFKGEKVRKRKKIKVEQAKPQKQKFTNPRLPKTAEDISANWKAFSAFLSEKKKKESTMNNASSRGRRKNLLNHKIKDKGCHLEDSTAVKSKSDEIWFDDVDPEDIIRSSSSAEQQTVQKKQTMSESDSLHQFRLIKGGYQGLTKHVAMDCEMVGVGVNGKEHMLARVSIVNIHGHVIYDKYVAPQERVIDYRTAVSGIRPENIKSAPDFKSVQQEVFDLLDKRVLIGHAVQNDLKVLFLDHPHRNIRDTSRYKPFQNAVNSKKPSLKKLAKFILGMDIQSGEHCSVQDAQVTMKLYCMHKKEWERKLKGNRLKGIKAKQDNSNPSDLSKNINY